MVFKISVACITVMELLAICHISRKIIDIKTDTGMTESSPLKSLLLDDEELIAVIRQEHMLSEQFMAECVYPGYTLLRVKRV